MLALCFSALFAVISLAAMGISAFCAGICLRGSGSALPGRRKKPSEQELREIARKQAEIANFFHYDGTEMPSPEEVSRRHD